MKKSFFLFLVCVAGLSACTDKSADFAPADMRTLEPFHYVVVNGRKTDMNMALVQTPDAYRIGVQSRHADSLSCSVRNDTLFVNVPVGARYSYDICLCAPEFRKVEAALLNRLYTPDTLCQDSLMVEADLVKKLQLNVNVAQIRTIHRVNKNVSLSGSADVAFLGNQFADMDLDASKLQTKDLYLSMGNGKAKINVSEHLWIKETFDSQITYVGNPVIEECNLKWSILKNALYFY